MEIDNNDLETQCFNMDNNDFENNNQRFNISDNNKHYNIFEVDKVYLFKKIRVLMNSHEMPYLHYSNLSSHLEIKNNQGNCNENEGNLNKGINAIFLLSYSEDILNYSEIKLSNIYERINM